MRVLNSAGSVGAFLFGTLWSVGWLGACLYMDVELGRSVYERVVAAGYPTVEAVVEGGKVEKENDDGSIRHVPSVAYAYEVGGKTYRDTLKGEGHSRTVARANGWLAEHPVGRRLTVYYAPSDPAKGFLRVGLRGADLMSALFLAPFHLIGGAVATAAFLSLRGERPAREERSRPVEGIEVVKRPGSGELRVRLPEWSARFMGWLAAVGLGVAAGFAVQVATAGDPPVWLVLATGLGVALASHGVYKKRARRIEAGEFDLVLDVDRQAVTIPATHGRKTPRVVPYASVRLVQSHCETAGEGGTSYVVRIHWDDEAGERHEDAVVSRGDYHRAEEFARWLDARIVGRRLRKAKKRKGARGHRGGGAEEAAPSDVPA